MLWLTLSIQGGAIAAAFAAMFPHLVRENVVFLAAVGLVEVCLLFRTAAQAR